MQRPLPVALPFDPNPRAPNWVVPANACDAHFHVFGPPNIFAYAADRRYEPPAAPIEHYLSVQRATGLTRGVIVQPSAHGTDNAAILDAIARAPGRLKGIANIDATMSDATLDQLKRCGIVGARFSLMSDRAGDRAAIEQAIPRLQRLGWSLDLHIDTEHLLAHADFIGKLPLTTVIDHMGRPDVKQGTAQAGFQLVLALLRKDHFWTKICTLDKLSAHPVANVPDGLPFRDTIPFAQAVVEAAPSRVVWGTDWPHGNTFVAGRVPNEGTLLDLLAAIVPDAATRHGILVDNPARLYRFDTAAGGGI